MLATTGRPRRYCSDACKVKAWRSREAIRLSHRFDKLKARLVSAHVDSYETQSECDESHSSV
jgi:hypothetical protein